jgi:hypothetical protein
MANIGAAGARLMLDWVFGGAAATQPSSRLIALSTGTPTSVSASGEIGTGQGYTRQTMSPGGAASPAGSVSNNAAVTFGPFSSSNAIQGLLIYDTISVNSGSILWYGTLLTARTVLTGDTLFVSTGGLIVTLS